MPTGFNISAESRAAMVKHYLEGASINEAAAAVGLSPNSCRRAVESAGFQVVRRPLFTNRKGSKQCRHCLKYFPRTAEHFEGQRYTYCRACKKYRQEHWKRHSIGATLSRRFTAAKVRSQKKGIPFDLTRQDLKEKWEKQGGLCFYTGRAMTFSEVGADGRPCLDTVSLDRVVPSEGYVADNIVLCCLAINFMKWNMSDVEFRGWCKAVVKKGNK